MVIAQVLQHEIFGILLQLFNTRLLALCLLVDALKLMILCWYGIVSSVATQEVKVLVPFLILGLIHLLIEILQVLLH